MTMAGALVPRKRRKRVPRSGALNPTRNQRMVMILGVGVVKKRRAKLVASWKNLPSIPTLHLPTERRIYGILGEYPKRTGPRRRESWRKLLWHLHPTPLHLKIRMVTTFGVPLALERQNPLQRRRVDGDHGV